MIYGGDLITLIEEFEFFRAQNVPIKLNNTEKSAYQLLVADNALTKDEMAIILGVSKKTISRSINVLKGNKLIERVGSNKKDYWEILK